MWIYFKIIHDYQDSIYLPRLLAEKLDGNIRILFGQRSTQVKVKIDNRIKICSKSEFNHPITVGLSDNVVNKLNIVKSLTYQMKYKKDAVMIGPVIGLLLGNQNDRYSPFHMVKYSDRKGAYDRVGGLIYAFSPKSIDWGNELVYGLYYHNPSGLWKYGHFPFPCSIYRRDFHSDEEDISKLMDITKGRMFNSWRFSKLFLYEYLSKNGELSKFLPATGRVVSYEQIKDFIDKYKDVILKPANLSRGRGICIIRKDKDSFRIYDYRGREAEERALENEEALKEFFDDNEDLFDDYIIQKCLSLAKIDGRLFDIRIVMQKDTPLDWKKSGIECRVAANGNLVTNISRGGYAVEIDEALDRAFHVSFGQREELKKQLDDLCYKMCSCLDEIDQHFAEFGIDIAIDEDKKFWIIEVNVFPSFKGFARMNYETYLIIRHAPVLYASYLAGF